jgi:PAS domain S-box-containing protein
MDDLKTDIDNVSRWNTFIALPLIIFILAALLLFLSGLDASKVFEPSGVLPLLNAIFLFACPMVVVYVAVRGYMASGSVTLLMLGSGVFSFALGSLIAGFVLPDKGPNAVITIHNSSALLAGLFHMLGVSSALTGFQPEPNVHRRKKKLILAFSTTSLITASITYGVLQDLLPIFFVHGQGPTSVRQSVLGAAALSYLISGIVFLKFYGYTRSRFLYWYATALLLIFTGLCCIFLQNSFGSLIGWTGRAAQYLAGVYLLAAVFKGSGEFQRDIKSMAEVLYKLFRSQFEILLEERTEQLALRNEQLRVEIERGKQTLNTLRESEENAKRLAEENAIMAAIGRIVSSTFNVEDVYGAFAGQVKKILPFDRIVISIIHPDKNTTRNAYIAGEGILDRNIEETYPLEGSGHAEMVRTKATLLIQTEDFLEYQDRFPGLRSTFHSGFRSIMNVPLFSKGEIIGALLLRSRKFPAYTEKDVSLAERIGAQVAGAIANAQLYNNLSKTDKTLRESEGKFRALAECAPIGIYIADKTGACKYVNRRWCEAAGLSPEEAYGQGWVNGLHPDDRVTIGEKWKQSMLSDGAWGFEYRFQNRTGHVTWVYGTAAPLYAADGTVTEYVGTNVDITERKQSEEDRRANEEILRSLFNAIHESVCLIDCDGRVLSANETFARRLKKQVDGCIGRSIYGLIPADLIANRKALVEKVIHTGQPITFEDERLGRWLSHSLYPVLAADGTVVRIAIYATDITEGKQVAEELALIKQRLELACQSAGAGTWDWDMTCRQLAWSRELYTLFGLDPDAAEATFDTWNQVLCPDDRENANHRIENAIKEKIPLNSEYRISLPDGRLRWISALGNTTYDQSGQPVRMAGICTDITERKFAEQEKDILADIGRMIGSTLEIDEVYERVAAEIRKLIPCDSLIVNLNNPQQEMLVVAYASGLDMPGRKVGDSFPLQGTLGEEVIRTKNGMILQTENPEDLVNKFPSLIVSVRTGMHSIMSVPLISRDEVVGILMLRSTKPNAYTEENLHLAERIGMQIAGAIANAQLYNNLSKTEMALRESEAKYRQLFDNAPTAIYQIDFRTGKFLKANDVVCEYLGCHQEAITSCSPYEIMTDESKQLLSERLEKMGLGEEVTENPEYEVVDKKGIRRWLQLHSKNIYNAEGMVIGADVVAHDITERKQAEQDLKESEERFRLAYRTSPDAININRLSDGLFVDINEGFTRLTGFTREEVIDRTSLEIDIWCHPEDRQKLIRGLQEKRYYENLEADFRRKDGSIATALMSAQVFVLQGIPHILSITRDISDLRQAEEERRILEERLQRSERMESLGILAGGVAHDLNNVLGVLFVYTELLLEKIPEGSPLRSYVENILSSGEKGAAVIQDLLTLARRGVMVQEVVNVNNIVSGFFKTPVFERIETHHPRVTFRKELSEELLNIKGSPIHLEKTVMNLLSNAAEAISGDGGITIRTENRYLDKPVHGYDAVKAGEYVVLTVSDTGGGISTADMGKIFEPFYTKKVMGRSGTGLGLAIVWGTVKDHDGYIDVRSEAGKGTVFTLYFPVTREEAAEKKEKMPVEQYMGQGESILVVDDTAEQRDIATRILTRLGYKVQAVSGGEEAVEYLKGNKADLLVLDMIMDPGIDGLETYERVLEVNPKQRAIIVSGFSETERVKKAQDLGAGTYVRKPYLMEKIGVAVRDELRKRKMQ